MKENFEKSKVLSDSMVGNFVPKKLVKSAVSFQLRKDGLDRHEAKEITSNLFKRSIKKFKLDPVWEVKLNMLFKGTYPEEMREFIHNGAFAFQKYQKNQEVNAAIKSFSCDYLQTPKRTQSFEMAPGLIHVDDDGKATITADYERFLNLDKLALKQSSLIEVETYNRPCYGVRRSWHFDSELPKYVIPATLANKEVDEALLREFLKDLRKTFSFKDEHSYAGYLAYLIQPYFSHLNRGLMPAYFFSGPTQSGKGYLSHALPGALYAHSTIQSTIIKKLPENLNQTEVFLWSAKDSIFIVFDEVKNATVDQVKVLDALVTSDVLTARKLHTGYLNVPNDFVIALTAVSTTFSDETAGRLVDVALTRSMPNEVGNFHQRWKDKASVVLSTLCQKLSAIKIPRKMPQVPSRRDGFSLIAYVLKEVFEVETTFPIGSSGNNEFLDFLVEACARGSYSNEKGRFTLKVLREAYKDLKGNEISPKGMEDLINTHLAYGSTKRHPVYSRAGYAAEDGNNYHIRYAVEGVDKRKFLYIKKLNNDRGDRG